MDRCHIVCHGVTGNTPTTLGDLITLNLEMQNIGSKKGTVTVTSGYKDPAAAEELTYETLEWELLPGKMRIFQLQVKADAPGTWKCHFHYEILGNFPDDPNKLWVRDLYYPIKVSK